MVLMVFLGNFADTPPKIQIMCYVLPYSNKKLGLLTNKQEDVKITRSMFPSKNVRFVYFICMCVLPVCKDMCHVCAWWSHILRRHWRS